MSPRKRSEAVTSDEPALPPHYPEAVRLARDASLPARVGHIVFGTAGWTDPSLIKSHAFYPKGASRPENRLRHYAEHFPLVEVDASYYTILEPTLSERWVGWTPSHFRFNVKAHASMTRHPVDLTRLPRELRDAAMARLGEVTRVRTEELPPSLISELANGFERFLEPLIRAGKLGCVLFQFPPWFEATRGNARFLHGVRERWTELPIAFEFRHGSWLEAERRARVLELLRSLAVSYVIVDEPQGRGGGVPPVSMVSCPELALIRMHGHNETAWARRAPVAERFDYLYRTSELESWAPAVRRVAEQASSVHVIFNNCVRDFAILNAKGMSALVQRLFTPSSDPS